MTQSLLFLLTWGCSFLVLLSPVFVLKVWFSDRNLNVYWFIMCYVKRLEWCLKGAAYLLPVYSSLLFAAKNRNQLCSAPLISFPEAWNISTSDVEERKGHPAVAYFVLLSHDKLGNLFAGQVQREVLVGSLDGKWVLLAKHASTLIGKALIAAASAAAVTQLLSATECVAVGGVLAELRPLQAVLLIEADVV